MNNSTESQTFIKSILSGLNIEEEIIQLGIDEYYSAGGFIMLVCFLLLYKCFSNHDDLEYLVELERLEKAKKMEEEEKKEWLRKKYNELKASLNLPSNIFLILDGIILSNGRANLNEALQAVKTKNNYAQKLH